MKKGLVAFLSVILVVVIIVLFGLGYFGLFAPTAKILGTDKPKDLGVTYTEEDLKSVNKKFGLERINAPTGTATRYEGSRKIDEEFSSAELTALVNSSQWAYTPIENVQIRIGEDGYAESSGILRLDLVADYFAEVAPGTVTQEEINKVKGLLPESVPYYISGTVSFENDSISIDFGGKSDRLSILVSKVYASSVNTNIGSVTIGRFDIPSGLINPNQERASNFVSTGLKHISGLSINSLEFESGSMKFNGTVPEKKYRPIK